MSHLNQTADQDIKLINEENIIRLSNKIESIGNDGIRKSKFFYKNVWRLLLSYTFFGNGEFVRKSTIKICNQQHINVSEIYIPNYADAIFDSKYIDTNYFCKPSIFRNKCVFVKNVSFLANQSYWADINHLNTKGSNVFTNSLYCYLLVNH